MFTLIVILLAICAPIRAYPSGAPVAACESMTPNHGAISQDSANPYKATTSSRVLKPGEFINITISGNTEFKGFLVQVRNGNLKGVGKFILDDDETLVQTLNCSGNTNNAITHTSKVSKKEVTVTWEAPNQQGVFEVVLTVVQSFKTFWAAQKFDIVLVTDNSSK